MSSTVASSPWPASARSPDAPHWRLAQEVAQASGAPGLAALQWRMVRHPSFAPGRLLQVFAALCLVSLGIGLGFWRFGAPVVLPLAGLELLLLGLAFVVCSRHARDAETITLAGRALQVEHHCGRQIERAAFRAEWVRVEPVHGEGSLVELTGQGQRMRVGRYLRPDLRRVLASELRRALRRECMQPVVAQQTHLEQQR